MAISFMILQLPTIFLDFDGVLHTMGNTGYKPFHQLGLLERELSTVTCDFQIVVSSSWRFHYSLDELRGQLGGLSSLVVGITPEIRPCSDQRYHEIMEVVVSHGLEKWIAIDDAINEFPPDCENLLPCDPRCGLQETDARILREWLLRVA
jgi:hypothetical protein